MGSPNYSCEKPRPLTPKERRFIHHLTSSGLKVEIRRVGFEYRDWYTENIECELAFDYSIRIEDMPLEQMEDSTYRVQYASELLKEVYTNVLDDSIRYYISTYYLTVVSKEKSTDTGKNLWYIVEVSQNELSKYSGIEIVRNNEKLLAKKVNPSEVLNFETEEFK